MLACALHAHHILIKGIKSSKPSRCTARLLNTTPRHWSPNSRSPNLCLARLCTGRSTRKPAAIHNHRIVVLAAGDVVVCPSEMEHRVGAVTGGTRASLNVDFWDVDAADDRRSDFDRY